MWRDDLKITAKESGLRLVSYYVPAQAVGRRLADTTIVRADRKKKGACIVY